MKRVFYFGILPYYVAAILLLGVLAKIAYTAQMQAFSVVQFDADYQYFRRFYVFGSKPFSSQCAAIFGSVTSITQIYSVAEQFYAIFNTYGNLLDCLRTCKLDLHPLVALTCRSVLIRPDRHYSGMVLDKQLIDAFFDKIKVFYVHRGLDSIFILVDK